MRSLHLVSIVVLGAACHSTTPSHQSAAAPAPARVDQLSLQVTPDSKAIAAIRQVGMSDSLPIARDLAHLTDDIGPRLTGSAGLERANAWTADRFRAYGMDSTWLESWEFGRTWERGPLTLRLLEPQRRWLTGASWAWSPGTDGPLAGDVVYLDAKTVADFTARFGGKLRGKWVMTTPPLQVHNPDAGKLSASDSVKTVERFRTIYGGPATPEEREYRSQRNALLAGEGIAGLIRDGGREFGLLIMSGSPSSVSPFPQVVVSDEEYGQFSRLIALGVKVRIEADIKNTFGEQPVRVSNTLAELRGSEKPDEIVLLGAHLDSWDLGTGATDNGTGAIAVLEAARILKESGVKPKRTIRFALFTGEEQGLLGSEQYVAAHVSELPKYQAVLVLDNGTGRIKGVALQGRNELEHLWRALFAPIATLGPFAIRQAEKGGTDHKSFLPYGVPGFNFDQVSSGYDHTWHSQVDTYDHAIVPDVQQAATVMAATAYQLANLPELIPRNATREAMSR
jgi:hypothetical protein